MHWLQETKAVVNSCLYASFLKKSWTSANEYQDYVAQTVGGKGPLNLLDFE